MKEAQVLPAMSSNSLTQTILDSLNVEQAKDENRQRLDEIGGIQTLFTMIELNPSTGLTNDQVAASRNKFGNNEFPESPMHSYLQLLIAALSDTTLLILIASATVSVILGELSHPGEGWIEGTAIFIAVFLVSNISAGNDYSKQLQFRALEQSSQKEERTSVLRDGVIERINPKELVVGDVIVLQAGDQVPADAIIFTKDFVLCNESSLTGEPDDLKKSAEKDCFLLSSCLVTEGEECRALVIGIGLRSQWGKIKANLVSEAVNTPLQDKLEDMTKQIGYVGMFAAFGTFLALVISIWLRDNGKEPVEGFVNAFIVGITIVVVAIPEGLPLAVTISLAYSTKKMYQDQCFIRVLAACETMGNATNICSDKTGTLTENRMTVVEGYFGGDLYDQEEFVAKTIPEAVKRVIVEQCAINRTAYLVHKNAEGKPLDRPAIIGNKTEGALILMIKSWGFDHENIKQTSFREGLDKIYSFNSAKKRSTAVVHRADGSVRLYCKGASEWIVKDCTHFLSPTGQYEPMTESKRAYMDGVINGMADKALRTLCLAHKDYRTVTELPSGWVDNPPDHDGLVLDCIVGIIDPLRSDVKEAVRIAQRAGVTVRMVTGDNIATAKAIARQCGILTDDGVAVEGPAFRKMSPKQVDAILPKLQVMARSSPDDKFLLVTRLNGHGIPESREEWESKMRSRGMLLDGVSWEKHRDALLPGYRAEWEESRPDGGDVVAVTGDGTNDAPALKAADVGMAMGITGTKVAQGASDIVILDDKFSSIVRAISWGRCVYDNIRKFLQFQLCVNLVALSLVFIGALAGFEPPLNAVQLLWVNLVMDTMGALALGTGGPTPELLERRPYKRNASLLSWPMRRNILAQSAFQLTLLLVLLFAGAQMFGVKEGVTCERYKVKGSSEFLWNPSTRQLDAATGTVGCDAYHDHCSRKGIECLEHAYEYGGVNVALSDLDNFDNICLECTENGYVHGSIIFNTFIFCTFFNEYTALNLFDDWNFLPHVYRNPIFIAVSIFTFGAQIFLIELGGEFVKTSPLTIYQWLITIALGAIGLPIGVLMRFIPVKEDPNSFFDNTRAFEGSHKEGLGRTSEGPTVSAVTTLKPEEV